jgi:hypothetical protein
MIWLRCFALRLILLAPVIWSFSSGRSAACDMCRLLGTTAFHVEEPTTSHRIGGDALDDALGEPHDPDDEGGSASFVQQGGKWPQPGSCATPANCRGTPITLTYSFENLFARQNKPDEGLFMPNGGRLPDALIRGSIEEALSLWAGVAPLHFVEVEDDGLEYGKGATKFGTIRFRHAAINGRDPTIGDPAAKAQAYFPSNFGNIAGDVEFDHDDLWQEVGQFRQPDILGAAIHEIGHTLGLGHTSVTLPGEFWNYQRFQGGQIVDVMEPKGGANMYWIFTRYSGLGTGKLFPDDVAGIQAIYGAGVGSVTSLAPEPASWLLAVGSLVLAAIIRPGHRRPLAETRDGCPSHRYCRGRSAGSRARRSGS